MAEKSHAETHEAPRASCWSDDVAGVAEESAEGQQDLSRTGVKLRASVQGLI